MSDPIIDTHQHLWDLKRFHLPWIPRPGVLSRSYGTADYLRAMRGMNVVQAVYMEVAVAPAQAAREAERIVDVCRDPATPTEAAVVAARPERDDFRRTIRALRRHREIKGVRRILHPPSAPRGLCLRPRFVKNVGALGDQGMSFDLCMRPGELADGARLAARCPGTRFIVDHCGNADPKAFMKRPPGKPGHDPEAWKRDMAALAARRNVICKISGIVARVPKRGRAADLLAPIVDFCLDTFGPDRVVFGSDWPVCLMGARAAEWIRALRQILSGRPRGHRRKLLHDNALRLYGLR